MDKFFNCDVCGRAVNGITRVNGMDLCAKCYQETFGNRIFDYVGMLNKEMSDLIKSNAQYTGQLLKENAQLKERLEQYKLALELACQTLLDINYKMYNTEPDFVKCYIEKAKEQLKEEKDNAKN